MRGGLRRFALLSPNAPRVTCASLFRAHWRDRRRHEVLPYFLAHIVHSLVQARTRHYAHKKNRDCITAISISSNGSSPLAVRGGFEPPVREPVRQFSKLVVSATHPSHLHQPLHIQQQRNNGRKSCVWLTKLHFLNRKRVQKYYFFLIWPNKNAKKAKKMRFSPFEIPFYWKSIAGNAIIQTYI